MFEMHDIIEGWLLDSTEGALKPWKARLTRAHLKDCARCRGFALELVEFSHDLEAVPRKERLNPQEASLLHSQVLAAFYREREDERHASPAPKLQLRTYFGVRPQFAKAMGLIIMALGLVILMSLPAPKEDTGSAFNAAPRAKMLDVMPVPEPSATATPFPKLTPGH